MKERISNIPVEIGGDVLTIRTDLTQDEWNDLADTKLQELLQTASGSLLLAAIRESKDRLEGKPMVKTMNANATAMTISWEE